MRINGIIWLSQIIDKLISKHSVEIYEVEEIFVADPLIRFIENGERKGEDVYAAYGQTDSGRYLMVIFIYKKTREALVVSARDMTKTEKRLYARR
jgi:uncharacterized protein